MCDCAVFCGVRLDVLWIGEESTIVSHHWQKKGNCSQKKITVLLLLPPGWRISSSLKSCVAIQYVELAWKYLQPLLIFCSTQTNRLYTPNHYSSGCKLFHTLPLLSVGWKIFIFWGDLAGSLEPKKRRQNIQVLLNGNFPAANWLADWENGCSRVASFLLFKKGYYVLWKSKEMCDISLQKGVSKRAAFTQKAVYYVR